MSTSYYRLIFEPVSGSQKITSETAFAEFLLDHFPDLGLEPAGYIVLSTSETVGRAGPPFWQAFYRESPETTPNQLFVTLASKQWMVGDHYVILKIKPNNGGNEVLFPIWK